ncbi:MAG: glycosyltransferase family 39 protein [Actinobacteria bacterium]|nr:glycosyltransferase family 39 protein [Actinomycetota bacterium]
MVLTAGAALLRFLTLRTQSYWYDEAITVELVRRPFHAMLGALPHSESTPPLYYVLAWIWSRMLGTGETGLRSLSAVLGTLTVPATYAAAQALVSRRSALFAAALVAVSPFLVWYSQEARAYALLVLLGALSLVPLRRAVRPGAGPPLAAWAIVASLALTTHYFALFLVLAEAIWLLRHSLEKRAAAIAVAAVAAVAGALAPLAAYQARYSQHTAWISNAGGVGSRAEYLLHQLVVGLYPASHIRPLIAALPVLVLVRLFAWTDRAERAGALVMLWFGLAAIGAPAVLALVGDKFFGGRGDYFIYRNLIVATVPLTIVAAAVIGARRTGRLGAAFVVVTCVLLSAVSVEIAQRPDLQKPDLRGVAAALGAPRTVRAVVVDTRTATPLSLYLRNAVVAAEGNVSIREVDLILEPGTSIVRSLPRGFHRLETRRVRTFRIVRLRARQSLQVSPSILRRELATSGGATVLLTGRWP